MYKNLDFFKNALGCFESMLYNSMQILWCDMAHNNLLNNFLYITLNNEACILVI